jgi:hypothetical protein
VIITGTGKVILTDKEHEITLLQLVGRRSSSSPRTCWPARRA